MTTHSKNSGRIYLADNVGNKANVTVLEVDDSQEVTRIEQFQATGITYPNYVQKITVSDDDKCLLVTTKIGRC